MSVAGVPWNQFNPHSHFPDEQTYQPFVYQQPTPSPSVASGASQSPGPRYNRYASFNMAALSPDELERFQKLSNEYRPDLPVSILVISSVRVLTIAGTSCIAQAVHHGNCGGLRQCRSNLRREDQGMHLVLLSFIMLICQELARTHPISRVMKGDGNCGWRGMYFAFRLASVLII